MVVIGLKSIHEEDKLCFVIKIASSVLDFKHFSCLALIKLTCKNILSLHFSIGMWKRQQRQCHCNYPSPTRSICENTLIDVCVS